MAKFSRWTHQHLPGQVIVDEDDTSPWSAQAQRSSLSAFKASMGGTPSSKPAKPSEVH